MAATTPVAAAVAVEAAVEAAAEAEAEVVAVAEFPTFEPVNLEGSADSYELDLARGSVVTSPSWFAVAAGIVSFDGSGEKAVVKKRLRGRLVLKSKGATLASFARTGKGCGKITSDSESWSLRWEARPSQHGWHSALLHIGRIWSDRGSGVLQMLYHHSIDRQERPHGPRPRHFGEISGRLDVSPRIPAPVVALSVRQTFESWFVTPPRLGRWLEPVVGPQGIASGRRFGGNGGWAGDGGNGGGGNGGGGNGG